MTVPTSPEGLTEHLVDRIAEAVRTHPSVVRLEGGEFGVLATHFPGGRIVGVRVGEGGAPVEVAVVLRLDRALPEVIEELRTRVIGVAGQVPVDVTVTDVLTET